MRGSAVIQIIRKHPVAAFFTLTVLVYWAGICLNMAGVFPALGEHPLVYEGYEVARFRGRRTLLNWIPNIAAIIVTMGVCGVSGLGRLFRPFCVWKTGPVWWLAVFGIPVAISVLAVGLYALLGGALDVSGIRHLPAVFGMRFLFSLSLGSIGEEAGWRGFALPRLQKRCGALKAALIIGAVWGVFHWPTLLLRQVSAGQAVLFLISVLALSVLLAWIFNSTGSLLLTAVFHNMINAMDVTLTHSFVQVAPRWGVMPFLTLVMAAAAGLVVWKTRFSLGQGSCSA